mmetsp:Transcript_3115/g.7413  ORF Transcript_3115/g.7413 Transcript_3115/m.7413 type:complete len:210 (-) Transcript_3115:627-1256(-)
MSLVMRSSIIFFTFLKGSSLALIAATSSVRLPSFFAAACRKSTTFCTPLSFFTRLRSWAKECPFRDSWSSLGRCLSAAPATAWDPRISMAFSMASISPARVTCRFSYACALLMHSFVVSCRYSESAFRASWVFSRSFSLEAFLCWAFCLSPVFVLNSASACSMLSDRPCWVCSYPNLLFISSFSSWWRSSSNLWRSSSRISTIPPDWDS